MTWVEERIGEWRAYKAQYEYTRAIALIPEDIQVGKVLDLVNGDIDEAKRFIRLQHVQDQSMLSSMDHYWVRVLRLLEEQLVNSIIVGET